MRYLIYAAIVILICLSVNSVRAQSCAVFDQCERERDPSKGKDSRAVSRPKSVPVPTALSVSRQFTGAAVEVWPGGVPGKDLEYVAAGIGAFIRSSGFKRNPALLTEKSGLLFHYIDVVESLEQGKKVVGYFNYAVAWHGAIWPFQNAASAQKFIADPVRYLPAYGGYCAYCFATGHMTTGEVVGVYNGKLHLFWNESSKKEWDSAVEQYTLKADKRWAKLPITAFKPLPSGSFQESVAKAAKG